jgi:hypothetical protein
MSLSPLSRFIGHFFLAILVFVTGVDLLALFPFLQRPYNDCVVFVLYIMARSIGKLIMHQHSSKLAFRERVFIVVGPSFCSIWVHHLFELLFFFFNFFL